MRCFVLFAAAKSNGETIVPSARILRRFHSRARINTNEFNTRTTVQQLNFEEIHCRSSNTRWKVVAQSSKLNEFKIKCIKFSYICFFVTLKCIWHLWWITNTLTFFKIYYISRNSWEKFVTKKMYIFKHCV